MPMWEAIVCSESPDSSRYRFNARNSSSRVTTAFSCNKPLHLLNVRYNSCHWSAAALFWIRIFKGLQLARKTDCYLYRCHTHVVLSSQFISDTFEFTAFWSYEDQWMAMLANSFAKCSPIPLEAPVMRTVCPVV